uniref:Uncharacterized protein n=1 Tax=Parascaris equorum TaxID=6256 RepID=A0A914RIU6_PAREQ
MHNIWEHLRFFMCFRDLSSNTGNIVTILKTFSFCEAPMLTVRLPKKKVLKEVNTDACFEAFEIEEQITLTRKCEWLYKMVVYFLNFVL